MENKVVKWMINGKAIKTEADKGRELLVRNGRVCERERVQQSTCACKKEAKARKKGTKINQKR